MNLIYKEDRKKAFIFSLLFSVLVSIGFYYIFTVSIYKLSQFSKSEEVIEIVLPSESKLEKPSKEQKIVEKQQKKLAEKIQKPKIVHKTIQKPVEEKVKPMEKPQEKPQNQIPTVQPLQNEVSKIEDTIPTKTTGTPQQPPPKPQENLSKEEKEIQKPKVEEKPKQVSQKEEQDQMKKYYQTLYAIIERNKYYPSEAKRRGEEGTPVVKVTIGEDGKIQEIVLIKSSGSTILDKEVVNLLRSIGKFPPPPGGRSITVNIAVEYSLGG